MPPSAVVFVVLSLMLVVEEVVYGVRRSVYMSPCTCPGRGHSGPEELGRHERRGRTFWQEPRATRSDQEHWTSDRVNVAGAGYATKTARIGCSRWGCRSFSRLILHYTALHYTTAQHSTALHCTAPHRTAPHCRRAIVYRIGPTIPSTRHSAHPHTHPTVLPRISSSSTPSRLQTHQVPDIALTLSSDSHHWLPLPLTTHHPPAQPCLPACQPTHAPLNPRTHAPMRSNSAAYNLSGTAIEMANLAAWHPGTLARLIV